MAESAAVALASAAVESAAVAPTLEAVESAPTSPTFRRPPLNLVSFSFGGVMVPTIGVGSGCGCGCGSGFLENSAKFGLPLCTGTIGSGVNLLDDKDSFFIIWGNSSIFPGSCSGKLDFINLTSSADKS